MLTGFFASLAKYLVLAITVIAVLNQFGVQTTSLIAVLGAAGLAIGLALQGTLSNVAAGVMLLFFRPFKIGDYIDASGITGTVKSVGLFVTELATPDNVHIVAPNAQLWGTAIHNYSHNDTRRVDLVVGVAYEDDVEKALAILLDMAKADERVHADPEPFAAVAELADSSVNVTLRVWCDADNYWPLKFDLTKAIKASLDREGISIPYPQTQVHLSQAAAE
jgi:small conductance mechanosensitive channel